MNGKDRCDLQSSCMYRQSMSQDFQQTQKKFRSSRVEKSTVAGSNAARSVTSFIQSALSSRCGDGVRHVEGVMGDSVRVVEGASTGKMKTVKTDSGRKRKYTRKTASTLRARKKLKLGTSESKLRNSTHRRTALNS